MLNKMLDTVRNRTGSYWADRAVAQIQYADKLSKVNGGAYSEAVDGACRFVIDCFNRDGAITRSTTEGVEGILKDLSGAAKAYKIICAAHAHIDMNWMWGWDETVAVTLETFRTMLDLMNEYPGYTFSQSQASVYKIVEDYDPVMLEEIKGRVKEGRWEVTASTWVETDKNIPSGESLSRHILYTKEYLSELLDIDPDTLNIDFEPDTFGHNVNVPEILAKGGVRYYYHCRGYDGQIMYKWKAPSGASIVVYREPLWYNAHIDSAMALYAPEFCKKSGLDTMLKVYGVGDHGGGPTRRDIERIIDMNSWPVFPEIRFGTFGEYFRLMETVSESLPVVEGELNFVFDGCYTTQTRIKKGNRKSEAMLNEAELFSSMSSLYKGSKYPAAQFAKGWENVLFNHFHDIIPGSGVVETREYAMGLYQKALATANSSRTIAFRSIARDIDTKKLVPVDENIKETMSEGAGVGFGIGDYKISQTGRGAGITRIYHFFNSSAHEREEAVEVIAWDWNGDTSRLVVKDENGETVSHQILGGGHNHYWGHNFINLLIKVKVPPCGYSTYVMTEDALKPRNLGFPADPRVQRPENYSLENSKIKVTFDPKNASVASFIDKATGDELIDGGNGGGIFRYIEEDGSKGMTAWVVGRYMNVVNLGSDVKINWVNHSPAGLRSALSYQISHKDTKIDVTVMLDSESSLLKYDVRCDWREVGVPGKIIPQLSFCLPLGYPCRSYKYDVPFGAIVRDGMDIDVPANSWVLGLRQDSGKKALMLVTDSKYGFRSTGNSMSVTLIRSSVDPDPYPEFGVHRFGFAIGAVDSSTPNSDLIDIACDYNHTISVLSGNIHGGDAAPSGSYLVKAGGSIAVSAVKIPESDSTGRLFVRVYETEGQATRAELQFPKNPKGAFITDINEKPCASQCGSIEIAGDRVKFDVAPFSLANIVVEF